MIWTLHLDQDAPDHATVEFKFNGKGMLSIEIDKIYYYGKLQEMLALLNAANDTRHISTVSEDEYRKARTRYVMPIYGGFTTAAPMNVQTPNNLYQISASQQPALLDFLNWINDLISASLSEDLLLGNILRNETLSLGMKTAIKMVRVTWSESIGLPPPIREEE